MTARVCVTGCAGFVGHHLVRYLKSLGYWVRGVDLHYSPYTVRLDDLDEFFICDLRHQTDCHIAVQDVDRVYHLAANMGGMGFITTQQPSIILNNTLMDVNILRASIELGVTRLFFSSSVCVYPMGALSTIHPAPLTEAQAYPPDPQESYGWEKLHMEHMCRYVSQAGLLETRIARFQNVYGPESEWGSESHRAKAPAGFSRMIAQAKRTSNYEIPIWGDGKATRSFMYVDDCVRGAHTIMESDWSGPVTLGPDRVISIDGLVDLLGEIAGIQVIKKYVEGPEGVRGRNFDHTLIRSLGWRPQVTLEKGMERTFHWVEDQVVKAQGGR